MQDSDRFIPAFYSLVSLGLTGCMHVHVQLIYVCRSKYCMSLVKVNATGMFDNTFHQLMFLCEAHSVLELLYKIRIYEIPAVQERV